MYLNQTFLYTVSQYEEGAGGKPPSLALSEYEREGGHYRLILLSPNLLCASTEGGASGERRPDTAAGEPSAVRTAEELSATQNASAGAPVGSEQHRATTRRPPPRAAATGHLPLPHSAFVGGSGADFS